MAAVAPAANATEVMSDQLSRAITARQPNAAPPRSDAYKRPTCPEVRVSAIVTTTPERTNGIASTDVATATAVISISENSVSTGIGMQRLARCVAGIETASHAQ